MLSCVLLFGNEDVAHLVRKTPGPTALDCMGKAGESMEGLGNF